MEQVQYSPEWVRSYYDQFGAQEWERLVKSPAREAQLAVHGNALRSFVKPGDRVLEIGAGPGRFTQMLSEIGATVVVTDISEVQLELNRRNAQEYGFEKAVSRWRIADICELSEFGSESFDAVLAFGGPLSYVLDRRERAVHECKRVLKSGGVLLVGVMSLWGTVHQYLEGVMEYSPEENLKITSSGDLTRANARFANHFCHMFRSTELRELLETCGLSVEFMSASGGLTAVHGEMLDTIRADETKWNELLRMEIEASQEPGFLDAGTHLIGVGRT